MEAYTVCIPIQEYDRLRKIIERLTREIRELQANGKKK